LPRFCVRSMPWIAANLRREADNNFVDNRFDLALDWRLDRHESGCCVLDALA
jgi:hypothetical protein